MKLSQNQLFFIFKMMSSCNIFYVFAFSSTDPQKQPSRRALRKRCSENMQSNFSEITLRCCPVNLLHIFKTPFLKNTSGQLLLHPVFTIFQVISNFDSEYGQSIPCNFKFPDSKLFRRVFFLRLCSYLQFSLVLLQNFHFYRIIFRIKL